MYIEIISHCLATELPHYADALWCQWRSLVDNHPAGHGVTLTVCHWLEDDRTNKIILRMGDQRQDTSGLEIKLIPLDSVGELGRRCIGRNRAAKFSKADVVWFCDVDHCFGPGCLDALADLYWPVLFGRESVMVFPWEVMIHRDHATGDAALLRHEIDPAEFEVKRYRKAIGGVQIVRGDFAREHGYLDGCLRWQRPTAKPFGDFRDDVAYRQFCLRQGPVSGITLPGIYRMRHTQTSYRSWSR